MTNQDSKPDALAIFGEPDAGIARASQIATELRAVVDANGLAIKMGKGEHLKVEAWLTCGAMCGCSPQTEWVRPITAGVGEDAQPIGYLARVSTVRLQTGEVICAAECACMADEKTKKKGTGEIVPRWLGPDGSPEWHAIISMAQTRATSKAMGQALRWIPVLAGYSGTPAEEVPPEGFEAHRPPPSSTAPGDETGTADELPEQPGPDDPAMPQGEPFTPEGEYAKWLDDKTPIGKGEHGGKTWRYFSEGAPGGGRHQTLEWMVDTFDPERGNAYARARRVLEFVSAKGNF